VTSARAACPLCGSTAYEIVYDLRAAHSPEDVPGLVVRCRACPTWFKVLALPNGVPTAYPGEYGDDPMAATYLVGSAARALFRRALAGVQVSGDGGAPHLLDIGTAQGALLEEAVRLGFAAEGLDHCEANVRAARAKGLAVTLAAAEEWAAHDRFDVITMMDIIEHLRDPLLVLRNVYRGLKPGGELVVYTPNHRATVVELAKLLHAAGIRYPVQEIFGRNHLVFFDDRSLPLALQTAGFEVRAQQYFRYDTARPGQDVSRLNLALVGAVEWLGKPFGRVFRMLVYARKGLRPA